MTLNDSADGVFGDFAAPGGLSVLNIANFVINECGLTHAEANLQGFGNLKNRAGPLYASSFGPFSCRRLANAGVATTQSCRLPKEDANQLTNRAVTPIFGRINALKLTNGRFQKLQPPSLTDRRKRLSISDDLNYGGRRDLDERTRRDLDDSDDELY